MYHFDFNYGLQKIAFIKFFKIWFGNLTMGKNGPSEYLRPNYVGVNDAGEDILIQNSNSRVQRNTAYDQVNFMQRFLQHRKFKY